MPTKTLTQPEVTTQCGCLTVEFFRPAIRGPRGKLIGYQSSHFNVRIYRSLPLDSYGYSEEWDVYSNSFPNEEFNDCLNDIAGLQPILSCLVDSPSVEALSDCCRQLLASPTMWN